MTTAYVVDQMKRPNPIAHIVIDQDAEPYYWPEGCRLDTWKTRTITDVANSDVHDVRDYISNHHRDERNNGTAYMVTQNWDGTFSLATSWNQICGVLYVSNDCIDRRRAAISILDEYAAWCRGDVYGIVWRDAWTGNEVESCWGYIGRDWALEAARIERPVSKVVEAL